MANDKANVGLIAHPDGAHLTIYFSSLAGTPEVGDVFLADPTGETFDRAREILKEKLKGTYRDVRMMLEKKPLMAVVSLEAATAPPAIDAALNAGCHVLTEKPACVRLEDFAKLVQKADSKHLRLMPALANRLNPPVLEARRLVRTGALGKIFGVDMHIIADQTRLTRPAYHASWFAHKDRAGGGHLIWLGIHWLDLG
jgi:predicted dehydrogenase